jgi:hypothetical protein
MRLLKWTRHRKGYSLIGFADIALPNGLEVLDCVVHRASNGRCWGGFPGKPQIDAEGRHLKQDGKPQYRPTMRWKNRELSDRFSDALVALVREHDPDAFKDEAPAPSEVAAR